MTASGAVVIADTISALGKGEGGNCTNHCEIDGHYIGYVECFEGWCRRWAKDKWQEERSEE